jgi:energy-converting hydrogenase Eha subunit F
MNVTTEPTLVKAVLAFLAGLACTILGAWDSMMIAANQGYCHPRSESRQPQVRPLAPRTRACPRTRPC